jgi:DNA-binding GntR family transcriptional regulator
MPAKTANSIKHWLSPGEMPLHLQVQVILATRIATGEIKIGDRLPSESELSDALGVSRSTLRLALAEFEREGLIERTPRRGTFMRRLPPPRTTELARKRINLNHLMGSIPHGHLVRRGYEIPPSPVARELALPPGRTIAYHLRVHENFMDGRAASKRYIRNELLAPRNTGRMGETYPIGEFSHGWIEAIPAEPRFAGLLRVDMNVPLMSVWWVEHVDGSPSICSHVIFPGGLIAFTFDNGPITNWE